MSDRPNTAAEVAASLRALARKLDSLGDAPMRDIGVSVTFQPGGDEDAQVATIDLLGHAILGRPGEVRSMTSGNFHHDVRGRLAGIAVGSFCGVASPDARQMRAELKRLRAELAAKS